MRLRLSVSRGSEPPFDFEHSGPVCNLGRDPACELSFPEKTTAGVSWRHARIDLGPDGAWVSDLNSSNGTFVGERRIAERTSLQAGDEIQLGKNGPSMRVVDLNLSTPGPAGPARPAAIVDRSPGRSAAAAGGLPAAKAAPAAPGGRARQPVVALVVLTGAVVVLAGLLWWHASQIGDLRRRIAELEKATGIVDTNEDLDLPAPSTKRGEVAKVEAPPKGMLDVLLRKQGDEWQRLRAGEPVHGTDVLTVLPGYRGNVHCKSGVQILFWGDVDPQEALSVLESRVTLHEPPAGIDLDLTVERGRLVLTNDKDKGEAVLRLRFRDNGWEVRLPDRESGVAVELRSGYLLGAASRVDGSGPVPINVLNFVTRGKAEVKVLKAPEPGQNADMLTFRLLTLDDAGKLWPQLPEYWAGTLKEPTGDTLAVYKQLRDYLDRAPAAIAGQLREARQAGEVKESARVVGVFGLGAVDDLSGLVAALEDGLPSLREAAMLALRQWLGRNGDNDKKAYDYLKSQKQFSDQRALLAIRWLHGLAEQDQQRDAVAQLLNGLADPSLALRQLAKWRLGEWLPPPEKVEYDPAADAAQRSRAIEAWKASLPAELKPAAAGKGSG